MTISLSGCVTSSGPLDQSKTKVYDTRSEGKEIIKTVVLPQSIIHPLTFNKGNFSIIVESDIFYDRFSQKSKISGYNQSGIQKALTEIKNISKNGNSIQLHDSELGFSDFDEDVLFDLIAEGKARIYDEQNASFLIRVLLSDYAMQCGPTCGYGSERITTENKTIIFEKMIWIS
jgi:hypothetical protein